MVAFLREVEGVRATLMEMHQPEPGERHTALFARVCREAKVNGYFIYWPYGAQRSGLDVELGFLLWQLEHGKSLDIRLFVESGPKSAGRVEDGQFVARELGRRTRYYEDLVAYGVDLVEWASYSELWEAIYHHAHSWLNET